MFIGRFCCCCCFGGLGGLCFCVFDCLHARFFSHINFVCLRAYVCVLYVRGLEWLGG